LPAGARVFLTGRTLESLEEVAEQIRSVGREAETAQIDALDETAVDEHADTPDSPCSDQRRLP
jgi:3-oxoacyl-[acyl-carrier protein] reductase